MSIDTVNDIAPRRQYVAAAAQEDFDYPFPIFEDEDLVVDVDGTTFALNTDYTVTGEGEDAGGTVSFGTPMTGGEVVTIYRDIAIARDTDFQQNGPFRAAAINNELDKAFLIMQELESKIGRSLRLPLTAEATDAQMELSPLANWLGKYITINSLGAPEPADLVTGTLSQSTITALLYPQTTAEGTATVTPANRAVPSHDNIGIVYVDRYGINTVPGTTDMSTALQNAVTVGLATGCPVRFGRGAYKIGTPPVFGASGLMRSIDIGGVGTGTQVINAASASKPTFQMSNTDGFYLHDMLLTGNSTSPNDGIYVRGETHLAIRWRIERIVSLMPGRGIVLYDTNTGVIRDFKHWPDNGDSLPTVAPVVDTTDIDHGIYLTGGYVHDVSIYDADCFPRDSFKADACGIRMDPSGPSHGIRIFGSMVQGNAGDDRNGIYLTNAYAFIVAGVYHESSVLKFNSCVNGTIMSTNTGGVEGKIILGPNCQRNTIIGALCVSLEFATTSDYNNTVIGSIFSTVTDATPNLNRYINSSGSGGYSGYDRGGRPWVAVAYTASMTPSMALGDKFNIVPNNGTAFTVNEPATPLDGESVTIKIRNATGGALGALSWGAQIKAANTTQPNDGFSIIRTFTHDKSYGSGVLWIQTGADVTVAN
jgi:hypothetical protein